MPPLQFSKYRNITPQTPKREDWYSLPGNGATALGSESSNGLAANANFLAFRSPAGHVSITPLNSPSPRRVHSESVLNLTVPSPASDFDISQLDPALLLTGSDDGSLRAFSLPSAPSDPSAPLTLDNVPSPTSITAAHQRRIECVAFHPSARGVAASAGGVEVKIFDLASTSELCAWDGHGDTVFSVAWKPDASLLATTSRSTHLRIFDPRNANPVLSTPAHLGPKPSRALFLSASSTYLATSGTSKRLARELKLWDARKLDKAVDERDLEGSGGVTVLMWDPDASLLMMGCRGSPTLTWFELHPHLSTPSTPGIARYTHPTPLSTFTTVPKLSLDALTCEIVRTVAGSSDGNFIVPVSWKLPRRRYGEFEREIYPDTYGTAPALTGAEWKAGKNGEVARVEVDPAKRLLGPSATPASLKFESSASPAPTPTSTQKPSETTAAPAATPSILPSSPSSVTSPTGAAAFPESAGSLVSPPVPAKAPTAASLAATAKFASLKQSSFRFVSGKGSPKFDYPPSLPASFPSDAEYLVYARPWLALPIAGSGGRVAVLKAVDGSFGRLPPVVPSLVGGSDVACVVIDEWKEGRVVCGYDDGKIRVWDVPAEGVKEDQYAPTSVINAHDSRVNILLFHPVAKDLLISASPERGEASIKVWDMSKEGGSEARRIGHHKAPIFAMAWSPDGSKIATVSKDKKLRVVDARSGKLEGEADCAEGGKGGRLVWAGERIFVVGFGRGSSRQIEVHDSTSLAKLATVLIDVSPSLLSVQFDSDTNLLYLTGRGESAVRIWELSQEKPFARDLTRYETGGLQQGFALCGKAECDVKAIEVAKAWRLTTSSIELVSFTVPRTRPELFQDDLFPPTTDRSGTSLTASAWLAGSNASLPKVSLKPADMVPLSEAPTATSPVTKRAMPKERILTDEEKREQMMANMLKVAREAEEKEKEANEDFERDDSEWD
ncbi:DUF1900-domain-containing protein [Gonapodya prolifera JEL478]|uniref:Coronin n=1 Tax=Gonapodya prolifera (strain JEL478) TaxID=1344416 RepID=A0A139AXY7_GONPJ|nr:DUF1900-domain-containing protein [Gonapodya prolifera JEL478]|eukprot:KXS21606.1 DUF1900-domain-containing protein [Gonapodya prolifera JEL478]